MKIRLSSWFFLATLLAFAVMNLLQSSDEQVSHWENRTLQAKPIFSWSTWLNGEYVTAFEDYFTDHFIYRSSLIQAGRYIESLGSLPGEQRVSLIITDANNNMFAAHTRTDQSVQQNLSAPQESAAESPAADKSSPISEAGEGQGEAVPAVAAADIGQGTGPELEEATEAAPEPAEETPELLQQTDAYLVFEERALQTFTFRSETADALANTLNALSEAFGPELAYYAMIVPTQISLYLPKAYESLSDPQPEAVDDFNSRLADGFKTIDLFPALRAHQDEYIFFRTDHHWTALGAYYAYRAFVESLDMTPVSIDEFQTDQVEGFLGSAYGATLHPRLQGNPDTVEMYMPFAAHSYHIYWHDHLALPRNVVDKRYAAKHGEYAVFLEGDYPWGVINSQNDNGRRLAVVKDSYGNAFIPFLIPHFEEIYIIDPRFYKSDFAALIQDKGINEILFLNNIATLSNPGYSELLIDKLLP